MCLILFRPAVAKDLAGLWQDFHRRFSFDGHVCGQVIWCVMMQKGTIHE